MSCLLARPASTHPIDTEGKSIMTVTKLDTVQRIKPRNSRFWEVQVNGSAELEQITLATTAFEIGGGS